MAGGILRGILAGLKGGGTAATKAAGREGAASVIGTAAGAGVGGSIRGGMNFLFPKAIRTGGVGGVGPGMSFGRMSGLGGHAMLHAAPRFGVSAGIDAYLGTHHAEDNLGGAGRFALGAASTYLTFGAYRSMARGAVGSVLGAGARGSMAAAAHYRGKAAGAPSAGAMKLNQKRAQQYTASARGMAKQWDYAKLYMGGMFAGKGRVALHERGKARSGGNLKGKYRAPRSFVQSGLGLAGKMAYQGTVGLAFRTTVGAATGAVAGGRLAGMGAHTFGRMLPFVGKRLPPVGGSVSRTLQPLWPTGLRKPLARMGLSNKIGHMPMDFGMVGLGAYASVKMGEHRHDMHAMQKTGFFTDNRNQLDPSKYGGGITGMRRGPARNYGPALTLQLHQNHSRVMP